MKARPVQSYSVPAYPTRLEVLADPRLLKENLPAAWRFAPQMAGVVAIMLAANACVDSDKVTGKPQPERPKAAIVAPIFQHGEGRGATGCVVVSPPVFLSEEEALQVIAEEFSRAGIDDWSKGTHLSRGLLAQPLDTDLLNEEYGIAVEFVSTDDYFKLGGERSNSTAQGYEIKQVTEDLAQTIGEHGRGVYFGAFYDPVPNLEDWAPGLGEDWSSAWKKAYAKGQEEAKELLRQQVQDFIEWLQAQGVI